MGKSYLKKFKIRSDQSRLYFWVYIYSNVEELRKAGNQHSKLIGSDDNFDECHGLCHTYDRFKIKEDGSEELVEDIGTIRLAITHLGTIYVSHELVHAALHLYRRAASMIVNRKIDANFGSGCGSREETFAYMYGELFADMNHKLHDHKFWK